MSLGAGWYLGLAAVLFTIGALGLLVRRNVLVMFMCIELMLNAANLTFVTFSRMLGDIGGQVIVFFVLVVAAAEVVVGLGIVVAIFRRRADDHRRRPPLAEGLTRAPRRVPHAPAAARRLRGAGRRRASARRPAGRVGRHGGGGRLLRGRLRLVGRAGQVHTRTREVIAPSAAAAPPPTPSSPGSRSAACR